MREILDENEDKESIINEIERRKKELCPKNIVKSDILAAVNYQFNLFEGIGDVDDIDHLGNRRVRGVGELLQNQFRIGLARMERVVRERMTTQDPDLATPQGLINIKPVTAVIKEFFGSSQLSQFIDQKNPSKLTYEEEFIIDTLQKEFSKNLLLNKHIKFMYTNGSMYKKSNGSLLFHGCIPMDSDGNFQEVKINGKSYKGKAMLDIFDKLARDAYFSKDSKKKEFAQDICWYLVCGKKSPIFGKSQYSYFQNLLIVLNYLI